MRRAANPGAPGAPGAPSPSGAAAAGGVRLNKLLASRGLGARRKCDALIAAGSVRVNGTVVKEPGTHVIPERDRIEVHGRPIPGRATLRYLMVHKPVGVITTLDDPEGRPTIRTLLPPGPRLFPVGRLDADSSGLILVTNDGELAHHLMHPRYGVRKVYRARLDRMPDADQIRRLRQGVEFEPRVVSSPCEVRVSRARPDRPEIEIVLHEGRYRQVRRMCEAVGLTVVRLHRPIYGPLTLGELPRGAWRDLTPDEVRRLKSASARPAPRATRPPAARASGPTPRPIPAPRPSRAPGSSRGLRPSRAPRPSRALRSNQAPRSSRAPRPGGPRPSVRQAPRGLSGTRTGTRIGTRSRAGSRPRPGPAPRSGPGQSTGRYGPTGPHRTARDAGPPRGPRSPRPRPARRRPFGGPSTY
jgi:23S rRNA pseudouridine2605 synthase